MSYAPPLGTIVTVHFQHARGDDGLDEIVARAEVKHHHYLNFAGSDGSGETASTRAIGMRFLEFVDAGNPYAKKPCISPEHTRTKQARRRVARHACARSTNWLSP